MMPQFGNGLPNNSTHAKTDDGLPPITLISKVSSILKHFIWTLLNDDSVVQPLCILMFFFEAMLLELIIIKIPYTEIDYKTYMQQITQILKGEFDYSKIGGDTGPIVYPGGYVFIYSIMRIITKGDENLVNGQEAFRLLYLLSLALTFTIYLLMDKNHRVKPFYFYLLILSKRLHSIYVLRLFNDCFVTFFMLLTILLLQIASKFKRKAYALQDKKKGYESAVYGNLIVLLSVYCYSFAISIKMNALLYLPAYLIILYFLNDENLVKSLGMIFFGVSVQVLMNIQFLNKGETIRNNFFNGAFNFKRQFMYKWTINWKFLSEETFLDVRFHKVLLILHIIVLSLFIFKKWISFKITGKTYKQLLVEDGVLKLYKNTIKIDSNKIISEEGPYYIALMLMTCNLIGILFARSLHYQFLSWYYFSLPFLMSQSGIPMALTGALTLVHEWCWNAYPTTDISSACLVGVLSVTIFKLFTNENYRIHAKRD